MGKHSIEDDLIILILKPMDTLIMKTEKFKEENRRATNQDTFWPNFLANSIQKQKKNLKATYACIMEIE